jgi:hypothetical protein
MTENMSAMVKAAPQGGKADFGLYHKLSCQARIWIFRFNVFLALSFRASLIYRFAPGGSRDSRHVSGAKL